MKTKIDNLIRDITSINQMSKSEVGRRLNEILNKSYMQGAMDMQEAMNMVVRGTPEAKHIKLLNKIKE